MRVFWRLSGSLGRYPEADFQKKFAVKKIKLTFAVPKHRGVEQLVARRAHNPEAGGSSPSPATKLKASRLPTGFLASLQEMDSVLPTPAASRPPPGATDFTIEPVCVYSVTGKNRVNDTGEEMYGMLYFAHISKFEADLHSEMEKVFLFEELPTEWTYPLIQPLLIKEAARRGF